MEPSATAPVGQFSALNSAAPSESDEVTLVHEIPTDLLEKVGMIFSLDMSTFLRMIWSIILQRYVDSENATFAFWGPQSDCLSVSSALVSRQETVQEFWKRLQDEPTISLGELEHNPSIVNLNTGFFFLECAVEGGDGSVKHVKELQRGSQLKCQVVLAYIRSKQSAQLVLLSQSSLPWNYHARGLASAVAQTISAVIKEPDQRIGDLPLSSPRDKDYIVQWNQTRDWKFKNPSMLEIIHKQAAMQPDKIAICAWDGDISYHDLLSLASSMAKYLRDVAGVQQNDLVLLMTEKSKWTIVAQLAIWKAGGAFVPLEPSHPQERLKSIVQITKANLILCSESLYERATTLTETAFSITSTIGTPGDEGIQDLSTNPDSPAYILFTSGTTGLPKGVVMEQRAVAHMPLQAAFWNIEPESRVLQFAAYSFNISVVETYYALSAGATLCVISDSARTNNLPGEMEKMGITWVALTPSLLRRLDANSPPSTLQTVVLGGETMSEQDFQIWSAAQIQFIQAYGMSEHAGLPCPSPMNAKSDPTTFPASPIVRQWLVDPENYHLMAPIGAVGELVLESPSLAKGYLDNPNATASAFIKPPSWRSHLGLKEDSPTRMYRTDDLFKYTAGGAIKYVGRKGTMVKIRGQRVDLGEIEANAHNACQSSTRVADLRIIAEAAIPCDGKDVPIVALFMYSPDYSATQNDGASGRSPLGATSEDFLSNARTIRAHLELVLPTYMLPSVYLPLDLVPATLTGKLARRTLVESIQNLTREQLEAYNSEEQMMIAPSTKVEYDLHTLFKDALGFTDTPVGIHHSFMRLGGDSLAAMRLVTLSRPLNYIFTVADVLEKKTIYNLARFLLAHESAEYSPSDDEVGDLKAESVWEPMNDLAALQPLLARIGITDTSVVEDASLCSPIQEGFMFSHARDPRLYHTRAIWEAVATHTGQSVNIQMLERTWRRLCASQPILRTIFLEVCARNTLALQVVLKQGVRGVGDACKTALISSSMPEDEPEIPPRQGMDWIPKFQICQSPDDTVFCVLDIHHTLMDASSMPIIAKEFTRIYALEQDFQANEFSSAKSEGARSSYFDYVSYLARRPSGPTLSYWKSYLEGVLPCLFPRLRPWQPEDPKGGRRVPVHLDAVQDQYQRFCQDHGVTVATIFNLAWALVLRSVTKSDNVCFAYLTVGRDVPLDNVEDKIGPYLNTLLCHMNFNKNESLLQAGQQMQSDFIRGLSYQHLSLPDLYHALGLVGDCSFNTAVNILPNFVQEEDESSPITLKLRDLKGPGEYDIIILASSEGAALKCDIGYWARFMTENQAASLADALGIAVTTIVQSPQKTIRNLKCFHGNEDQLIRIVPKDPNVKFHGHRVDVSEVENRILTALPAAKMVVVEAIPAHDQFPAMLFAFISFSGKAGMQCTAGTALEDLIVQDNHIKTQIASATSQLRHTLPFWKVPKLLLPISQIPTISRSGDACRAELRRMVVSMSQEKLREIEGLYRQHPVTQAEHQLRELFSQVLDMPVERIWKDSHFFELGGTSRGAMYLVAAARKAKMGITVADIFASPVLDSLALAAEAL
ncbi:acetyl-CoA synthetase-like protein [Penicillium angulare]|uniref:Acetyl-CoA synthetase-like protein n=1 Tax=Penicillium angulare TaxID=116970 RepID=A0A9W9K946_9EURO|nr:acetyl-CoA synthetase-like protein [Penicillium angulare]